MTPILTFPHRRGRDLFSPPRMGESLERGLQSLYPFKEELRSMELKPKE